jgi:exodeoxyribonuclease VIII
MAEEIMVDLETWGTKPDAAIISIGAIKFNTETHELGSTFYMAVDPKSSIAYGGSIDAETIQWWMRQSDAARNAVSNGGVDLKEALAAYADWSGDLPTWGNGATFDNVILTSAFESVGVKRPWGFWNDRCFRTLRQLGRSVVPPERVGTAHNALDDAVWQANYALLIHAQLLG